MDNFNGFPATYQAQPNWYYQPTQTQPIYNQRNWYQNTAVPSYHQQTTALPPSYQQPQTNQPMNNPMVWVQGESGAKAYVLPNNSTMPLWDSEAQVIYIKSVDANGKPSMTILDYTDRSAQPVTEEKKVEYATKEQIDALNGQFSTINEKLGTLGKYVTKDQLESLDGHINQLTEQIEDIENRMMNFGKSQQNQNYNRKVKNNGDSFVQ